MVEKRGRKAAADVGIVPIMPGDAKPRPPEGMPEAEADVWRQTVAAMPVRYFGREVWPVLRGLCKQVVLRDMLGARLDERIAAGEPPEGLGALLDLYHTACRQVRQHSADLRLTKITRIARQVYVDAAVRNQALTKPWDL